jgi:hypothetical protein
VTVTDLYLTTLFLPAIVVETNMQIFLIWEACSEIKILNKGTEAWIPFEDMWIDMFTLLHIFADGFQNSVTIFVTSLNL